MQQDKLGRIR